MKRVAIVQLAADLSGSTISGQMMAAGFIQNDYAVDVIFCTEGSGIELYKKIGCTTHILPHKSWLRGGGILRSTRNIVQEWRGAAAWKELLSRLQPSLVYINSLPSLSAAVAARKLGLPVIWHLREMFDDVGGEMIRPSIGGKWLVRWVLERLADRVVAISHAVLDNVAGAEPDERHIVVANAADDAFFELSDDQAICRKMMGLKTEGVILGVPGTLRRLKGHPFLFAAVESLLKIRPDLSLAVTGTGSPQYLDELNAVVSRTGIGNRVNFLGPVKDMPRFYRACDLVCVPSQSEGFGRTVIEAFAVGVPVIGTKVGGIPEVIDDGKTGLLVNYGDVPAMSDAICRLLDDAAFRIRLIDAARQKAQRSYRAGAYQQSIVSIADCLLKTR